MATKQEISIAITAETARLQAGLTDAQRKLQQFANQAKKSTGPEFSLERIARAGLLVSASINSVNIASKAFSGNIQDAADAIKKLPLGIGQMASALEEVLGDWSGINTEIDNMKRGAEAVTKLAEIRAQSAKDTRDAQREFANQAKGTKQDIATIGLEGPSLATTREAQARENQMESNRRRVSDDIARRKASLNEEFRRIEQSRREPTRDEVYAESGRLIKAGLATGDTSGGNAVDVLKMKEQGRIDREKEQAQKQADKDIIDIRKAAFGANKQLVLKELTADIQAYREYFSKRITDAGKFASDMAKQQREAAKKERETAKKVAKEEKDKADDEFKRAQSLAGYVSEVKQEELKAQKRTREAELEAVRGHYDALIAEANRLKDGETASVLERLKVLKMAAAERKQMQVGAFAAGSFITGLGGESADPMSAWRSRMATAANDRAAAWQQRRQGVAMWGGGGGMPADSYANGNNPLLNVLKSIDKKQDGPRVTYAG